MRLAMGVFRCSCCEREWREELPPLWAGDDMWPECCERPALLFEPTKRDPDSYREQRKTMMYPFAFLLDLLLQSYPGMS